MYYKLCSDDKKINGMAKSAKCTNFQTTTLQRHVELTDHQMLVEAPCLRFFFFKKLRKKSKVRRIVQFICCSRLLTF